MNITIKVQGSEANGDVYIGWSPREVDLTFANLPAGGVTVRVTSTGAGAGLMFSPDATTKPKATIDINVTAADAKFFVCGKFGSPSVAKNDGEITVTALAQNPAVISKQALTVRIRKNGNKLTPAERDSFLLAYARLNNAGAGLYQTFRDMHTAQSNSNIHQGTYFLPWHRSYILDLERELQAIDPTIALPYWRFDQPAQNLFNAKFLGASTQSGFNLAPTNPLSAWVTDGQPGFSRSPNGGSILDEANTLALGSSFSSFAGMEGDPHGSAHVSFDGPINDPTTAVKDPLFFLLHSNVDRLWAKWQYLVNRYDQTAVSSYPKHGKSAHPNSKAQKTLDTMWPWDGVVHGKRPPTAPGGTMAPSSVTAPGLKPTIGSMIDYQGKISAANVLGFDYDDVPYWT